MGQTNRQAWAFALSETPEFGGIVYLENLGWNPRPDLHGKQIAGTKITVVRAWNLLPWGGRPERRLARAVNAWLTIALLRFAFKVTTLGLLVTFDPLSTTLTRTISADAKVYDCLDLYEAQPQYAARRRARELIGVHEAELAAHVEAISVSSPALRDRYCERFRNKSVVYVPGAPMPPRRTGSETWTARRENVAIYVGALDPYKVDFELFRAVRRAGYHVHLIGRVEQRSPYSVAALDDLLQDDGISLGEPVDRDDLIDTLANASIGLIAMSRSSYSDYSFPLKYWDYLWAGVPVLALNCRSLASISVGVTRIENVEDVTEELVNRAVAKGTDRDALRAFAAENSARQRVASILRQGVPR